MKKVWRGVLMGGVAGILATSVAGVFFAGFRGGEMYNVICATICSLCIPMMMILGAVMGAASAILDEFEASKRAQDRINPDHEPVTGIKEL
jgi:hypothetical protein